MLKANDILIPTSNAADQATRRKQNMSRLRDLKANYGDKIGGDNLREEFKALLQQYSL
jgi:hypothetical protein